MQCTEQVNVYYCIKSMYIYSFGWKIKYPKKKQNKTESTDVKAFHKQNG